MKQFKKYRKNGITELRPVNPDETALTLEYGGVSVSEADISTGSPKEGDMIARNPDNHYDQWLVSKECFEENYIPAENNQLESVSKNYQFVDQIEQARSFPCRILFAAAHFDNLSDLRDLISDFSNELLQELFPGCEKTEMFYENDVLQGMLVDHEKFGFFVEVHVPNISSAIIDESGEHLESCSYSYGICSVEYLYTEDLYELPLKLQEIDDRYDKEWIEKNKQ